MRLDKFLAQSTNYSRKEIAKLAKAKQIKVNDIIISKADYKIREEDLIYLDDKLISQEINKNIYIKINKPQGYISANKDSSHPTIMDLLPIEYRNLIIVGRLDLDTSGIILVTNDGQWTHKITSPKYEVVKEYLVDLADPVEGYYQEKLQAGILLDGEKKACLPAHMIEVSDYQVILQISEGKYHQVKRMFAALGNKVERLERVSISGINVQDIDIGTYAYLTQDELDKLEASCVKKSLN